MESHWRDRHSDRAPGRSTVGSWHDCRQGQEIFILSTASVPAVEPAQPDVRWERGCFPQGQNTRGVKLTTLNLVPSSEMMGAAPSGHHMLSYRKEGQIYLLRIALAHWMYVGCPESIRPFWISRELFAWPWCILAASQRRHYCASVFSHSPVGLVGRQWDAVDWTCVLCDRHIQNDRPSRSASSRQWVCPFYSSRAGFFFGKASLHPGLSVPLQPRLGFLRLLAFPIAKIAVEREETSSVNGVLLPTD